MTIQIFEKVQNHIQAIRFEGGRESGMEISRWVGSGSSYIPETSTDPFDYVQIPTMFGPRDAEEGQWVVRIDAGQFLTYKEEVLMAEYTLVEDEEKHLIQHARFELSKFPDEETDFVESIINTIKAFSSYRGHSGNSAAIAIHMVTALLKGENLLPLTNDKAEWLLHEGAAYGVDYDVWQNKRNSKALSYDEGKTYFLVDLPKVDGEVQKFNSEDINFKPEIDPEDLKGEDEKAFDSAMGEENEASVVEEKTNDNLS
jgi:hypothetical protein